MKRSNRRRRQGGWILIIVMMILLLLGLSVAGYYSETESHLFTGQSIAAYQLAALRAERGAQEAISMLRAGSLPVANITGVCNDTPPNDPLVSCTSAGMGILRPGGIVDHGTGPDLLNGGGLQFNYVIYRPAAFAGTQNLYAVRAIGYYGYTLTSNLLYTSELEVMVEVGTNTTDPCANAQDYGGCGGG
jgi:hypothetical protein